jgi:NADPH-dependent glutamate synthase beta subunit-like oxidoreductase
LHNLPFASRNTTAELFRLKAGFKRSDFLMTVEIIRKGSPLIGRRAIVIGAGISGLSAAGALVPYFDEVLVLERDKLQPQPSPARAFRRGNRLTGCSPVL